MRLEVGMVLYSRDLTKYTVTRVTATQAMCKVRDDVYLRFAREQTDPTHFYTKGEFSYGAQSYSIETPELKAKRQRKILVNKFTNIEPDKLSNDQLERMLAIAAEIGAGK